MASFSPDQQQERALAHATGALLVTGSAGTGKSTVLQERFARVLEGGADAERVALVVGSRRARDRARAALLERLGRSLPGLHVWTMHGLAYHVVTERHAELGYAEPPEILPAAEQYALVTELLRDQDSAAWPAYAHLLTMRGFADEVRQFLSRAQESLVTPDLIEERAAAAGLTGWHELAAFLRAYQQVLDDRGVVDFGGMLQQAARATATGAPLFDHLFVDDYQDTTIAGEELVLGLRSEELVVAGDPEAHVFSFQGTTGVPLLRFTERVPGSTHIRLETPHRAPETIAIEAWVAPHTSEEHAAVARELRRLHVEEGVSWGDLAVVARRQGPHLAGILRALDDARVPRGVPEGAVSVTAEAATYPYLLALRWLARPGEREDLIEPLLTSDVVGLSPAVARGLLRAAQTNAGAMAAALSQTEGLSTDEADAVMAARNVLARAEEVASGSVSDAFERLWQELPCSARLVANADTTADGRRDLDAVVAFSRIVAQAGDSPDPSVQAFVEALDAGEHGPGFAEMGRGARDAVQVLTAHGAVDREFDTVIVSGAVEGNFPSLSRPEPMFDLAVLDGPISQSERNRARYEDERRLFRMVLGRARRRVILTASDRHPDELSARSRFAAEVGVEWRPAPDGPFEDPVSVREAAAVWRRTLANLDAPAAQRLAALEGLAALGVEPARWWFQREWTDTGRPLHDELRLSFSRLSTLENCELQHVLRDELGLSRPGGYHAWVGKTVHTIIQEVETGEVEKSPTAIAAAVDARWRPQEFPSVAVSEAFRYIAKAGMLRNWFERYADTPALASEVRFEFEFEGATIIGYIDRIGPTVQGGTCITDFKSGGARKEKAEDNLQLGIYFLAVNRSDDLARFRPVGAVELAFLKGHWRTGEVEPRRWQVNDKEMEAYQERVTTKLSELISHERELIKKEIYRPDPYADCFFCEFKPLCPLYPEGQPIFAPKELVR